MVTGMVMGPEVPAAAVMSKPVALALEKRMESLSLLSAAAAMLKEMPPAGATLVRVMRRVTGLDWPSVALAGRPLANSAVLSLPVMARRTGLSAMLTLAVSVSAAMSRYSLGSAAESSVTERVREASSVSAGTVRLVGRVWSKSAEVAVPEVARSKTRSLERVSERVMVRRLSLPSVTPAGERLRVARMGVMAMRSS